MNLQDVRQRNNVRKAEVSELLEQINQGIEAAYTILTAAEETVKGLKAAKTQLNEEVQNLEVSMTDLKKKNTKEVEDHKQTVASLRSQYEKLKIMTKEAQDEYTQKIAERNALKDSIDDDKKDLKEQQLSFNAKLRAYKKEKDDFNFEKRKFQAEKSNYNDIL